MKLTTVLFIAVSTVASVCAGRLERRDVNVGLIPDFGVSPGFNPDGHGNCDGVFGIDGKPVLIPCSCPPTRDAFLQSLNENVNAGFIINHPNLPAPFPPTGTSKTVQQERIVTLISTLQNLYGFGVGCPVESTDFGIIQNYIDRLPTP